MNQDNALEEAAEPSPAAHQSEELCCGGVGEGRSKVVAFKFGGSSLLGAERMLHAARLVGQAAQISKVAVVVSAMKGVTDHLLSIEKALARGKLDHARVVSYTAVFGHYPRAHAHAQPTTSVYTVRIRRTNLMSGSGSAW